MSRCGTPVVPIALLGLALATAGSVVSGSGLLAAEITGEVTDEDDAPIAGAVVTLHPVAGGAERGALWLSGEAHPEPVARASTGEDGRFRIEAPDTDPPFWTVIVRADGRVPLEHEVGPLFDVAHLPPAALPESSPAAVRVVDADGAPVAGAAVLFSAGGPSPRFRFLREGWSPGSFRVARTGPGGRVSLPRAAGETGEVVVPVPGRFVRVALAGARLRVELPPPGGPGSRTLRVVGPGGSPVPEVVVWSPVAGVPRNVRVSPRMGRLPVAVTGEDGEAVLPAGALAGGAPGEGGDEAPGVYVETRDGQWAEVAIGPADEADGPLVARLTAPPSVRGTVLEPGGDPVGAAVVWVLGDAADAVRTSDTGGFALELPAVERFVVQAAGPGHRQPAHESVEGTGPASGIELVLSPTKVLEGRVEDGAGRGIEGASVEAAMGMMPGMIGMPRCTAGRALARSRADGRFRVVGISPGCAYTVTAERDGYAPGSAEVPPSPDDPVAGAGPERSPLRLVLSAGHRLIGRVVDDTGAPIAGARVVFQGDQGRRATVRRELPEAATGPEGLFSLAHLPPSTGGLYVSAPGFALLERPGIAVPDTPEVTDLGELALAPEAVLEVRVEDSSGDAVAGARVDVKVPSPPVSWHDLRRRAAEVSPEPRTDASGTFRAGGFRAGDRTRVVVSREGYAAETRLGVRVPEDSPLSVVLRPGAVVSGRVVDESGRPVSRAVVSTEGGGVETMHRGPIAGGEVDEGEFEIGDLPAGPVTLRAHGLDGTQSAAVLVELESGERRDGVELVLRRDPAPKILVRVVAPDGRLPPHAMVMAHQESSARGCPGPEEGVYTCTGTPGTHKISAHVAGVGAGEVEVEVGETDVAVDLPLEPEQEVSGRVVFADGEPAPGLRVRLHLVEPDSGFDFLLRTITGADGSFAVRGRLTGPYHLMIDREEGGPGSAGPYLHPETVEVAPGESLTGLLIRLEPVTIVRGRLLGVAPEEAGGVAVSAHPEATEGWRSPSWGSGLAGGRYEIRVTPGTWRIVASERDGGGSAEEVVTVAAGEAERIVDLDLSPGLAVAGVVRIGGEPAGGLEVWSARSPQVRTVTDLRGRFELHGLDPGRQELVVEDRYSRPLARLEIVPEERREVVVDVRVGRVRGTVLSAVGAEPVADARVHLFLAPGTAPEAPVALPVHGVSTAVDGRFLIDRVPVGTYTLTVETPGRPSFTTELHVTGGEVELPPVVLEPEAP